MYVILFMQYIVLHNMYNFSMEVERSILLLTSTLDTNFNGHLVYLLSRFECTENLKLN